MLPPSTHIGCVKLRVASLSAALDFYGELLGMRSVTRSDGRATLRTADGEHPLIGLTERADARPQPVFASGLYHTAFLLPRRSDLGRMLRRLSDARWPLTGGSDHGVSEALYLSDPDGNGVEIYSDRPRDQWPRRNGQLAMTTMPLDVDGLLTESDAEAVAGWSGFPTGTRVGHIHLRVPSIEEGRKLFADVIGFDVTAANYPGALFMSAGGYHHHVAINIWESHGAPRLPEDSAGLIEFEVLVPDPETVAGVGARAEAEGMVVVGINGGVALQHGGGIRVLVLAGQ